jgi:4-amino-4-deoxy-L-arabinose transferase-like glycosyltransferase
VVGVFWGTWFSLSRSMNAITASTFLEVGHTMIANLGGPMAVLMPATLVSALPVLFATYRGRRRGRFYLILAGTALLAVALVITLRVNVPIDDTIAAWTVDTLPSDWTGIPMGGVSRRSHVHQLDGLRIRHGRTRLVA